MKILKQKNSGYAILFAIVIVSVITMISIGLANTSYKQLVLSSLSSDSQVAYLQSDMSTECALYADNVLGIKPNTPPWDSASFNCGLNGFTIVPHTATDYGTDGYDAINLNDAHSAIPCFDFSIDKSQTTQTILYSRGYNICNKSNQKTVERTIKITIFN